MPLPQFDVAFHEASLASEVLGRGLGLLRLALSLRRSRGAVVREGRRHFKPAAPTAAPRRSTPTARPRRAPASCRACRGARAREGHVDVRGALMPSASTTVWQLGRLASASACVPGPRRVACNILGPAAAQPRAAGVEEDAGEAEEDGEREGAV